MNISKYGHLDRCVLIKGLFEESFAREGIHPQAVAFAFVDVYLTFSFRQCLEFIWANYLKEEYFFAIKLGMWRLLMKLLVTGF